MLWQLHDLDKSSRYLSIHRDFSEPNSYQIPHNYQLVGFFQAVKLSDEKAKITERDIGTSIDALIHSFDDYTKIKNFSWIDKCVISNLLMMAIADRLRNHYIMYYRKLFFIRRLFAVNNITPIDEAVSEILYVVRRNFPEAYQIIFSKNIIGFMKAHALGHILRELFLDVEKEFLERTYKGNLDIVNLYKELI